MSLNKDGTPRKKVTHRKGVAIFNVATAAGQLYDLLATKPEGLDIHQIVQQLPTLQVVKPSARAQRAHAIIRELRLQLGVSTHPDTMNLIIVHDPSDDSRRQIHRLSTDPGEEGLPWLGTRRKTVFSRIPVDIAVWRSIQEGCDRRTKKGRVDYLVTLQMISALESAQLQFANAEDFAEV